jgi:hypothetical protein
VSLREVAARLVDADAGGRRDPVRAALVVIEIGAERLLEIEVECQVRLLSPGARSVHDDFIRSLYARAANRDREVPMTRKLKLVLVAGTIVAVGAVTGGIAIASGVGDDDQPLGGSALEQATNAALAATGGGIVTETEVGDDGTAYGVEIRLSDGSQVEVELDENLQVIGQEADDDGAADRDEAEDD